MTRLWPLALTIMLGGSVASEAQAPPANDEQAKLENTYNQLLIKPAKPNMMALYICQTGVPAASDKCRALNLHLVLSFIDRNEDVISGNTIRNDVKFTGCSRSSYADIDKNCGLSSDMKIVIADVAKQLSLYAETSGRISSTPPPVPDENTVEKNPPDDNAYKNIITFLAIFVPLALLVWLISRYVRSRSSSRGHNRDGDDGSSFGWLFSSRPERSSPRNRGAGFAQAAERLPPRENINSIPGIGDPGPGASGMNISSIGRDMRGGGALAQDQGPDMVAALKDVLAAFESRLFDQPRLGAAELDRIAARIRADLVEDLSRVEGKVDRYHQALRETAAPVRAGPAWTPDQPLADLPTTRAAIPAEPVQQEPDGPPTPHPVPATPPVHRAAPESGDVAAIIASVAQRNPEAGSELEAMYLDHRSAGDDEVAALFLAVNGVAKTRRLCLDRAQFDAMEALVKARGRRYDFFRPQGSAPPDTSEGINAPGSSRSLSRVLSPALLESSGVAKVKAVVEYDKPSSY